MGYRFLEIGRTGKNNWWRYLLTLIIVIGVGLTVGTIAMAINELFAPYAFLSLPDYIQELTDMPSLMVMLSMTLFLVFCVHKIHKRSPIALITSHKSIQWFRIFKGMCIWFVMLSLLTLADFLMNPTDYTFTFEFKSFGWLLVASLIGIPFAAFVEEVFFRGYLLQAFSVITKRPIIPIIATSIIFGLGHYFNGVNPTLGIVNVIGCTLVGLMLGVIVVVEGGLETAIGVHIINNLFMVLICNNPLDVFGNIPSLLAVHTDLNSSLIEYMPGLILEAVQVVLLWIILFWGRLSKRISKYKIPHFFQ